MCSCVTVEGWMMVGGGFRKPLKSRPIRNGIIIYFYYSKNFRLKNKQEESDLPSLTGPNKRTRSVQEYYNSPCVHRLIRLARISKKNGVARYHSHTSLFDFEWLQQWHAGTRFHWVVFPPRYRGITWSSVAFCGPEWCNCSPQ